MSLRTALWLSWLLTTAYAFPQEAVQSHLKPLDAVSQEDGASRLHGRFLHITDIHPDPHYKPGTSTSGQRNCHRGHGPAGLLGAETTDCDTPYSLMNATFRWIDEHLKDEIDFVIWTGDSARHDADERIPRTHEEVLATNRLVTEKFIEVFHRDDGTGKSRRIPVVPTFGNNDILPHNILLSGPNKWLKTYRDIWAKFIPEEQTHGFERGGWFYKEVIPNKLAVFSLNTLYFFSNNAGVDGCEIDSEPGWEHMEWLRTQLQFIRRRNMKAILIGHVPPARTDSKRLWDESCWQKYALWLKQYRDVVIGGFFGHMNIDHFILRDTEDVELGSTPGNDERQIKTSQEPEFHVESASSYLKELRGDWVDLPNPGVALKALDEDDEDVAFEDNDDEGNHKNKEDKKREKKKERKKRRKEALKKMGGPWAERYQVTHVNPSVVPNYFPAIRVFSYNITGIESMASLDLPTATSDVDDIVSEFDLIDESSEDVEAFGKKGRKGRGRKGKKGHKPKVTIPDPPSETAPPGPAYSPQMFTLLGYTQYFANLTWINTLEPENTSESAQFQKTTKEEGNRTRFAYEVEYDTFSDPSYKLKDLTVRSWLKLACRIGHFKTEDQEGVDADDFFDADADSEEDDLVAKGEDRLEAEGKKKKKKNRGKRNKVWLKFVERAFVGAINNKKLSKFAFEDEALTDEDKWVSSEERFDSEVREGESDRAWHGGEV